MHRLSFGGCVAIEPRIQPNGEAVDISRLERLVGPTQGVRETVLSCNLDADRILAGLQILFRLGKLESQCLRDARLEVELIGDCVSNDQTEVARLRCLLVSL